MRVGSVARSAWRLPQVDNKLLDDSVRRYGCFATSADSGGNVHKRSTKQALWVPFTLCGRLENTFREQAPTYSLSLFGPEAYPGVFYRLSK